MPNVNDGFTGKAPDLGALELGQSLPTYGPPLTLSDCSNYSERRKRTRLTIGGTEAERPVQETIPSDYEFASALIGTSTTDAVQLGSERNGSFY
jgi:hypothetical protein